MVSEDLQWRQKMTIRLMKTIQHTQTLQLVAMIALTVVDPILCRGHNEHLHERITGAAAYSSWAFSAYLYENLGWNNFPYLRGPLMVFYPPPAGATWSAFGYDPIEWLTMGAY